MTLTDDNRDALENQFGLADRIVDEADYLVPASVDEEIQLLIRHLDDENPG